MSLTFALVEAGASCFMVCPADGSRPVGLAFDSQGRMFISSDASGEVYVVVRDQATTAPTSTSTGSATTGTSTGSAPASTTSSSTVGRLTIPYFGAILLTCALVLPPLVL